MKQQQSGFTLIELMIVVAIIGILAAIALPQYQNFIGRSQASESVVLLDGARTSVEDFVVTNGVFPTHDEIVATGANLTGTYGSVSGATTITAGDTGGIITYTFPATGVNVALQSATVVYTRSSATGAWNCTVTGLTSTFAPKGCL